MLGSRTKKVNSYGKRRQRVVNITSEERRRGEYDLEATEPKLGTVVPSIRNRENIVPLAFKGRKVSSPRVVIPRLKKRSPKTPPKRIGSLFTDTPARTPLAIFHPNGPGSPAILPKQRKKPLTPAAPSGLRKPFSPFIEMDITVIDDQGQTLKKERRVSRTDAKPEHESDSDSDVVVVAVRKPRQLKSRIIVVSDDSGSDAQSGSDSDFSSSSYNPPRKQKPQPTVRNAQKPAANGQRDATRGAGRQLPKAQEVDAAKIAPSKPSSNMPNRVYVGLTEDTPPAIPAPARYQPGILPIHKPRQLTPVRPGKNRLFAPPSPPSPTTTSELDFDFDNLSIGENVLGTTDTPVPSVPDYLRPLLRECNQEACGLHEFSAFISTFPFDPILSSPNGPSSKLHFRKVGEASYSEVFGIGDVVLKVIPLRDETSPADGGGNSPPTDVEQPAPTDVRDVLKEIIVTRAMGEVYGGFVKLMKAYVVRGRYPEKLLHLWDEYNRQKGSESIRPDMFTLSQVYAIIVLPNGGPDLETYTFRNATKTGWRQACSIFWQVAKSLAHAEQLVSFEHRDLHWGQILVKDLPLPAPLPLQAQPLNRKPTKKARTSMDDKCHGVQVTLIDLGLSRMDAGDGCGGEMIHWTPFDKEIFQGGGDYQFDIYRMMRDQNNGKWEPFLPLTNVMWLHYLLVKLLRFKGIRPPARRGPVVPPASSTITERECYECLIDLEQWLAQCLTTAAARVKPVKSRRKTAAPDKDEASLNPMCAGEVIEYGIKKVWIKAISR
ncbi:hypothetical protein F5146DRAFT_569379 [Armillaria mellea]|nr:hypothetical protein F5146DRAFT_569379 [Armillaria mellea]